eukprot:1744494-Prymnesium_polylepis.1
MVGEAYGWANSHRSHWVIVTTYLPKQGPLSPTCPGVGGPGHGAPLINFHSPPRPPQGFPMAVCSPLVLKATPRP